MTIRNIYYSGHDDDNVVVNFCNFIYFCYLFFIFDFVFAVFIFFPESNMFK